MKTLSINTLRSILYTLPVLLIVFESVMGGAVAYVIAVIALGLFDAVVSFIPLQFFTRIVLSISCATWCIGWGFSNWTFRSLATGLIGFLLVRYVVLKLSCAKGA